MMKKLSFVLSLLLISVVSFAQQALFGSAAVVSPEIHDDNTVTFRLKAPKAVSVQVCGDFLPPRMVSTQRGEMAVAGVADLKENEEGI